MRIASVLLPILFLFVTVFLTREDVRWLFALGTLLLVESLYSRDG
jgi:hypothetical protein